jgi:hypothetical protein
MRVERLLGEKDVCRNQLFTTYYLSELTKYADLFLNGIAKSRVAARIVHDVGLRVVVKSSNNLFRFLRMLYESTAT